MLVFFNKTHLEMVVFEAFQQPLEEVKMSISPVTNSLTQAMTRSELLNGVMLNGKSSDKSKNKDSLSSASNDQGVWSTITSVPSKCFSAVRYVISTLTCGFLCSDSTSSSGKTDKELLHIMKEKLVQRGSGNKAKDLEDADVTQLIDAFSNIQGKGPRAKAFSLVLNAKNLPDDTDLPEACLDKLTSKELKKFKAEVYDANGRSKTYKGKNKKSKSKLCKYVIEKHLTGSVAREAAQTWAASIKTKKPVDLKNDANPSVVKPLLGYAKNLVRTDTVEKPSRQMAAFDKLPKDAQKAMAVQMVDALNSEEKITGHLFTHRKALDQFCRHLGSKKQKAALKTELKGLPKGSFKDIGGVMVVLPKKSKDDDVEVKQGVLARDLAKQYAKEAALFNNVPATA